MKTSNPTALAIILFFTSLTCIASEVARVLDGGGGSSSSSKYTSHISINQPTPVGFSKSSKYLNSSGFLTSDSIASGKSTDTDNDGLSDWDEITGIISDPFSPTNPFSKDTDGDGVSDDDELAAGNNPADPNNVFEVFSATPASGFNLSWMARGGRSYSVWESETITGLQTNPTLVFQSVAVGGNGPWMETVMSYTNTAKPRGFYKIQTP